jgi:hypothetical protein
MARTFGPRRRAAVSRAKRLALAALTVAGTLAASENAFAYCRTKACDTDPSYGDVWDEVPDPESCVRNAQGCLLDGTPLFWPTRCITFGVQRDGSQRSGIDFDTAEAVIQEAFDKWAAADCGGEGPSFRIVAKGEIACDVAEYNQDSPNANVFMFRDDDWPYAGAVDTLALTTLTYNVETAEIYDADVELNSFETTFTTSDDPVEILSDFSSVVTHETGHFLGLSHSSFETAVMRGVGYTPGSIDMRTLTADDVAGICQVFPPGRDPGNSCGPRHGFSSECGSGEKKVTKGCALRSAPYGADPRPFAAFGAVALAFVVRRIRARRSRC